MIDFCFKGDHKQFVTVGNIVQDGKQRKTRSMIFPQSSLKEALKHLLNNWVFFQRVNKMFKQVTEIPMGSDGAPFFANHFLYSFESKWIK